MNLFQFSILDDINKWNCEVFSPSILWNKCYYIFRTKRSKERLDGREKMKAFDYFLIAAFYMAFLFLSFLPSP